MRTRFSLLCLMVLCIISLGTVAETIPPDLLILTEEFAPLNYEENGTLKGISVDLVESALQQIDPQITRDSFRILPWSEGYNLTQTRNNTLLFSTARIPEREELFLWAGPLTTNTKILYGIPTDSSSYSPDIALMRIVTVDQDSGYEYALQAGASPDLIITVPTAEEAIRMIENNSADAWSYGELAGERAINAYAKDPGQFEPLMEIASSSNYIAFNLNTSPSFVEAINATVWTLKNDRSETGVSEYERIIARYLPVQCVKTSIDPEDVTDLVNQTAEALREDATGTLEMINSGMAPYKNADFPELYVFVYSTDGTVMADADNPALVGKNMAGKVDATGKAFRDEIMAGAKANITGWTDYVFSNPAIDGLFSKKTYYRFVTGSDGEDYVVASGRYLTCDEKE